MNHGTAEQKILTTLQRGIAVGCRTRDGNNVQDGDMQMALATHMAQPTGATVTRGTFRVTINGFSVDQECWDDALQLDGKRNECFVWAESRLIDHQGNTLIKSVNRSRIIGDTNGFPDRLQGGTASTVGGLRTGDVYPRNPPWQRVSAPQPDRLPMLVFEGDLVQGQQGVAIVTSIWEWDGNGDLFNDFLDILAHRPWSPLSLGPRSRNLSWMGSKLASRLSAPPSAPLQGRKATEPLAW
jgi:hypothetical protein